MARQHRKTLAAARDWADHVLINGDGTARREYTHVLDVAHAYRLALESDPGDGHAASNLGSGTGTILTEIIDTARHVTGADIPVVHGPARPDPTRTEPQTLTADSSRLRHDLGWPPTHSDLDQVLRDGWHAWNATGCLERDRLTGAPPNRA